LGFEREWRRFDTARDHAPCGETNPRGGFAGVAGVDTDTRMGPGAAPALGLLAMSWRMGRARFEPSLICFIAFRSTVYAYRFSRIDAGAFT